MDKVEKDYSVKEFFYDKSFKDYPTVKIFPIFPLFLKGGPLALSRPLRRFVIHKKQKTR